MSMVSTVIAPNAVGDTSPSATWPECSPWTDAEARVTIACQVPATANPPTATTRRAAASLVQRRVGDVYSAETAACPRGNRCPPINSVMIPPIKSPRHRAMNGCGVVHLP
jgi:hypothetical protein